MKIAITGAAGFIGSNLAQSLCKEHEVLALDNFDNTQRFENGKKKYFGTFKNLLDYNGDLYCANLLDDEFYKVLDEFKPDVIYHLAAISDTTVYNEEIILKSNVNSFKKIINIANKYDAKLIYASSASVYGDAKSPQTVGKDERPKNPYAFSKLMMEKIANLYCKNAVGLRYFNVYGKNESNKEQTSSMILQFANQILDKNEARLFEGSENIFRDFVYIKDVTKANIAALNAKGGVYNVGSFKARSFLDIVLILEKELLNLGLIKDEVKKIYIKNPYEKAYQFFTEAAANKDFNYEADYSLEEGIKDYLPYILKERL
ncbi:NAD-dependent epimerase/dehydratase family protein [Campylobacter canadensis]|uniref:NAD-dependent epimerase/dehydratase family protein n=1 Tax=Campylobacter canadensis TaxID=449520 RepID=A0ABS7WQ05_9BACT|nr:NAD-dependent epimerase/dehydratase family protein [Campylobacter canadensis]MBZ7986849.1 NAD-dependent epimerase/dehydratase family protein [Campylobacter canadensis]MBZ7994170.1 NAD-dependent epimerase/dehydratase family protein [Campylobacter canadensis]MBZ7995837.1 NAD-dependent epimerase/dehydratase family protein [Campylobacter canadensis]MBZ7997886.1 NAD-dependent epimerase/dehydratase family protein [Campylobacter canadensis]MBZ7999502.1 NAD-dependent epimerase/dehydratase family pr